MTNHGDASNAHSSRTVQTSKVARVITDYELDGVGDDLEDRWIAEENRQSLRELADWFNQQVLQAAMENAGHTPLDGEVANNYRLLRDDDVSSGTQVQIRKRLERHGVDVDQIEDDFVSHQAVHTYLTKYRQVSQPSEPKPDRIRDGLDTIQRLQSRTAAVTRSTIDQLEASGEIEAHDVDVFVDVRVLCHESGRQYGLRKFLENGGCADE